MIYKVRISETKVWTKEINVLADNEEEASLLAEDMYRAGDFPEPHAGRISFKVDPNIKELGYSDEERMMMPALDRLCYDARRTLEHLDGSQGWGIPGLPEYLVDHLPHHAYDEPYTDEEVLGFILQEARQGRLRMEYMESGKWWRTLQMKYETSRKRRYLQEANRDEQLLPLGSFYANSKNEILVVIGLRPESVKYPYIVAGTNVFWTYRMAGSSTREKVESHFDMDLVS